MTRHAIVIRHVTFEDAGTFAAPITAAGFALRTLDAGVDDLSPARDADLLLVMGGPISANDEARYPFLDDEQELLRGRLAHDRPTLGICLGAQLLARASGARVYPGTREIGLAPLTLTAAGRESCLAAFATAPLALHWHGDTFDLPRGATLLASTADCTNQAFSLGRAIVGFQFHPEIVAGAIERWLVGHAGELEQHGISVVALRQQVLAMRDELEHKGRSTIAAWLRATFG